MEVDCVLSDREGSENIWIMHPDGAE